MADYCRYCGKDPKKNCDAKEGDACEYPEYKKQKCPTCGQRIAKKYDRLLQRD